MVPFSSIYWRSGNIALRSAYTSSYQILASLPSSRAFVLANGACVYVQRRDMGKPLLQTSVWNLLFFLWIRHACSSRKGFGLPRMWKKLHFRVPPDRLERYRQTSAGVPSFPRRCIFPLRRRSCYFLARIRRTDSSLRIVSKIKSSQKIKKGN